MFCANCLHPNPPEVERCAQCHQEMDDLRQRLFIGQQFVFIRADAQHPLALKVDEAVQVYRTATLLSRHRHTIGFGETTSETQESRRGQSRSKQKPVWPLADLSPLPQPSLQLLTIVTDRQIYQPNTEATLFVVAPASRAANTEANLEIKLAGQKVYEAKVALNQTGLALHRYDDLKEGEYTITITLPDNSQADCHFSVAEFTLSPLIATLEKHEYADRHLKFSLKLLLLSVPYTGQIEFGLQCKVCDDRVVATQKVKAKNGLAQGQFDISHHVGPFHVQITTPDGHTALVAFPGTGAQERERLPINRLGQTAELGLLPWAKAQPVRGFYLGAGEMNMTPLLLESVHTPKGRLQAATHLPLAQVVLFNPRSGESRVIEQTDLRPGEVIEFDVDTPYALFTVGVLTKEKPFEGWGIIIKPVAFEAKLTAPQTTRPGEEVEIYIETQPLAVENQPSNPLLPTPYFSLRVPTFCWLLVYDARLEHESPIPKLARRIYDSIREASGNLAAGSVASAHEKYLELSELLTARGVRGMFLSDTGAPPAAPPLEARLRVAAGPMFFGVGDRLLSTYAELAAPMPVATGAAVDFEETLTMVVTPTRMEFPELAYQELFYLEGQGARTVKLGDQIGTWRVRAYIFQGADYRELTADIQASQPFYAELDVPAIASPGDHITAAVNYAAPEPAELVIATAAGETRRRVKGNGQEQFAITGPGRVEVRLEGQTDRDWSSRDIAPPGVQTVMASRLLILDQGETVQGERVVVYPTMGQVLKDTIAALLAYPFG